MLYFVDMEILKHLLDSLYYLYQISMKEAGPRIKEREIYWCSIGYNVGYEEHGKGINFRRPVLIIKKFNTNLFWGVPLSTKIKEGNKYYFPITIKGQNQSALISQMRTFDSRRLDQYICQLDEKDFELVKDAVVNIIKTSALADVVAANADL
jgi:mRNA-degrading endonuclease toxin of MazEF toxin-antitoxin module